MNFQRLKTLTFLQSRKFNKCSEHPYPKHFHSYPSNMYNYDNHINQRNCYPSTPSCQNHQHTFPYRESQRVKPAAARRWVYENPARVNKHTFMRTSPAPRLHNYSLHTYAARRIGSTSRVSLLYSRARLFFPRRPDKWRMHVSRTRARDDLSDAWKVTRIYTRLIVNHAYNRCSFFPFSPFFVIIHI